MSLAALIVSVVAVAVSAWSANYQRMIWRWTRDGFTGPMPKWWHLRHRRSREPVVLENAEARFARLQGQQPIIHMNGIMTSQTAELVKQMQAAMRRRPQ